MPIITIDGGALKDMTKKRDLVRELTDAAVKAYGLPREAFVVLIKENAPDNIAVGGTLLVDRTPR